MRDLLILQPIKKVPGEHIDLLLAVIAKSRMPNGEIFWTHKMRHCSNGVLGAAAISLFESTDPDDTKALETLSRLWFEML